MVRVDKLRGIMAERGVTGAKMAEHLGITPQAFYKKMKLGSFKLDDAKTITDVLGIDEVEAVSDIFFADKVS